MLDYFGNEINEGDVVIYQDFNKTYVIEREHGFVGRLGFRPDCDDTLWDGEEFIAIDRDLEEKDLMVVPEGLENGFGYYTAYDLTSMYYHAPWVID